MSQHAHHSIPSNLISIISFDPHRKFRKWEDMNANPHLVDKNTGAQRNERAWLNSHMRQRPAGRLSNCSSLLLMALAWTPPGGPGLVCDWHQCSSHLSIHSIPIDHNYSVPQMLESLIDPVQLHENCYSNIAWLIIIRVITIDIKYISFVSCFAVQKVLSHRLALVSLTIKGKCIIPFPRW